MEKWDISGQRLGFLFGVDNVGDSTTSEDEAMVSV